MKEYLLCRLADSHFGLCCINASVNLILTLLPFCGTGDQIQGLVMLGKSPTLSLWPQPPGAPPTPNCSNFRYVFWGASSTFFLIYFMCIGVFPACMSM